MKKIVLSLLMLCTVVSAWSIVDEPTTVTVTILSSNTDNTNTGTDEVSGISVTGNWQEVSETVMNVETEQPENQSNPYWMVDKDHEITMSVPIGYVITSVKFTGGGNIGNINSSDHLVKGSCDNCGYNEILWLQDAGGFAYYSDIAFSASSSSAVKVSSVTVTYHKHSITHYEAVAATCASKGNKEYWKCSDCERIYSDEDYTTEVTNTESLELSIDPHNHNGNLEEVNEVLATCVSTGTMHHWHCTSCNHNFEDDLGKEQIENDNVTIAIDSKNHASTLEKVNEVLATCVSTGNVAYWHCTSCNHNYSDESGQNHIENDNVTTDIAPTNHVEKMQYFPSVAATCAAKGTGAYYYCSHCEKYYINETDANAVSFESLGTDIDPNNHNGQLKEVAYKNASCSEEGVYHHWHCEACGNDYADANATEDMNGKTVKPKYDADALLVSNSTIDESYLLGDGAKVTFNTDGDIAILTIGSESHEYEINESDPLNIEFSHTFKLTAIQDPNNTANYYATFYTSEGAYKLPEGVTAYTGVAGKSGENNVVVLNEIDNIIHKNEAVILRSNSANITLMPSSNKNAAATGNVLTGTDEDKNLVTGDYALSSGLNGIGFYKWDNKSVAANNAYLNLGENKGDIFYLAHVVSYVTNVEGKTVPNDTIITDSKIASEPSVTNEGYKIDGWYTESTFENKWDFANDVVTENITLHAQWIQQFTVTFETNGAAETINSQIIDNNEKVEEPTVSKDGYKFLGWYTEDSFTNEWDFANNVVTKDITLYANWNQYLWYIGKTNPEDAWAILDDEGTLTIYGEGAIQDFGNVGSPFYMQESITEVVFDNVSSITSIGENAFEFFTNLTSITLPKNESFTEIAQSAFYNCSKLSNVTIPNSVTTIEASAFAQCVVLADVTIPNSVTTIGEEAFRGCMNLSNITLPENELFTEIAPSTFAGCTKLSNITIPNNVTTIGETAFAVCLGLTDIVIPNSVTTIGNGAFFGCTSLTELTIPSSVTTIGNGIIVRCGENLKTIAFEGTPTTIGDMAFIEISETPTTPTLLLPNNWGGEAYVDNKTEWYGGLFNLAHVVSYNTNSSETVSNDTILHNEKLTAPTVSKTGYKLLGWYTESTFENEWDFATDVVTENITLYAKWIEQFTVTFVTNGAAETIESQTIDINQKVTEPSVSKTGYKFLGWYTEDSFTNEWDFANNVVTKDITLYAQWIQQFVVTYNTNGANETIQNDTIVIGNKITTEPSVTKNLSVFDGWYTENTFSNKWDFANNVVTKDTTLYAKWIQQFVVTYNTNGANETIQNDTIVTGNKITTEPSVTKTGYKFLGWYTEDTFTNEWDFATDVVTENITLYAKWLQQFTVTFVTNGATETVESQTIDINQKVTEPSVSKAGYKFLGWYTEDTFTNEWDFATDVVTANITLYAQWLQQFTVTFVTNGAAETIESRTIDINQKVMEPSVSKAGCELRGWYTESTFENKWNFATDVVTANTTLYALWHQHVGVAQSLAATCETDGYMEHFVCECGKAFTTADCTTEILDLAAWKIGEGKIPAIGHNYVKGDWKWADDYSEAILEFVCENDNNHVISVDATITSETTKQTCSADGKITYFASALYEGDEYKTSADSIIPAAHIYVVKKWAWADDFKSCIAKFVCQRDIQHTANVEAVITTSTNDNNQPVYIATATIDGVEYTDTIIDNIYYVGKTNVQDVWAMLDNDGTLTFYGEGDMMDFENNPPYFAMRDAIKQVVFDESANITSIGEYALASFPRIESITISNTVEKIGTGAFSGCIGIKNITLPNTVKSIGGVAFAGCNELKTITLPEQLTAIEPATFTDCYSLSSVTIPDGVTTIGEHAFADCGLENITIPNSVTTIGESAFVDCTDLKAITLSENLTAIAPHTFEWCDNLTSISIPESVTTIGAYAFEWCESLSNITIPEGVTTIGEHAFEWCYNLTSISISNSVTTIEDEAFFACKKLSDITIPSGVTTIGSEILAYCFCGSVTFEGTPTNIAEDAFKEISIKPVLTLPEGWTGEPYVDSETLWYGGYFINKAENKFFIGKENPGDAWAVIDENGTLTIFGTGETQDYNYNQGYENSPFLGRSDIKNIVFDASSNITALGSGTFMFCPNLANATIPNTVTSIGVSAFAKSGIATITLSDNLTEIANYTFAECKNLTDVTIPSNVAAIGYRAFYGCRSFENITVPNTVISIAEDAFIECKNLKQITLSENMERIESGTFLDCSSLETITIPSKVTFIGREAFGYCNNLKNIILSNGLTTISGNVFHYCTSLERLTIPATVTSVGEKIFGDYYKYDKGNFESLRFLGTPDNIDDNAFNYINGEMGQASPVDLYLPFDWSGEEWVDSKTPWYGGYFNLVKEDPTFFIGKENPEDAWAVFNEETGTFTIYGSGATQDYYDEDWNWTKPTYYGIINRIKSVVFDESSNITSIGISMFEDCENLESIIIPNSVTSIGNGAFQVCKALTNITLSEGLTEISDYAFNECKSLENITFPSSVTTIGQYILNECYNLQSVTFEATPERIDMYAFSGFNYSDNPIDLYLPDNWDGLPYINSETPWYEGYFNSTPSSIYKFYIGKENPKDAWAIWDGDNTLTIYGSGATQECVEWGENWSSWTEPTFYCIYDKIKNVVFDESSHITTIGSGLFGYLDNLENITIPNTVTNIGREAFDGCAKLNDITIPASVLSIGKSILGGAALRSVTFEGTPTTIDEEAFAGMNTTPHLLLPTNWSGEPYVDKDTEWNGGYFDNELEKIFYIGKYTPEDVWAKLSDDGTLTIYGHGETRDWEDNSPFLGQFITTVVFDDDAEIVSIGNRTFFDCKKITDITLPNTITEIGSSAFGGCDNLTDITIPNSVITIGGKAFYSCSSIKSITIPNSVTSIGAGAFGMCYTLEEVTLSSNMTTIEDGLFQNCHNLKNVIIPNGITTIGSEVFVVSSFTDITLPNSLTEIAELAFWSCNYLESITIPRNVSYIGRLFLNHCPSVQSVTFRGTPDYIDGSAFGRYNDPSHPIDLYLPIDWSGEEWVDNQTLWYGGYFNLVKEDPTFFIGKENPEDAWAVFNEADSTFTIYGSGATQDYYDEDWWTEPTYIAVSNRIKNVVFDESSNITSIGNGMFYSCENLESITIPNSVTSIGVSAFGKCKALTNITLSESLTEISNYAFYECESLDSITIPNSVTSIGMDAFEECYALTNITLPESLIKISNHAFHNCESLESITIPNSVTSIGVSAFGECKALTNITLSESLTEISNYAFYECESLESITIPNSVTSIGEGAFEKCYALTNITLSEGLTEISDYAFNECESLESITIPNSVTSIGEGAFEECYALTNVTLSDGLTEISSGAFYDCDLKSITIPSSVTTIGGWILGGCSNLQSVTFEATPERIDMDAFSGFNDSDNPIDLYLPDNWDGVPYIDSKTPWRGGYFNSTPASIYKFYIGKENPKDAWAIWDEDGTFTIYGSGATQDYWTEDWFWTEPTYSCIYEKIKNVVFDESSNITSIGSGMFESCENLESITIPNSITSIGADAFYGCGNLESIAIPNSVTFIGESAFGDCYRLTNITLSENITEIAPYTFYYCESIESITIPNGVTSIGEYAFAYCEKLASITLPNGVTTIGEKILNGAICVNVTFEGTPTTISNEAFKSMLNKPVLTLPDDWSGEPYVDENTLWYGGYFYSELPIFYIGKNNPEDAWAELSDDGTLTIYGHGETQDWNENSPFLTISLLITKVVFDDDAEITSLGQRMFDGCRNIETITIPNSVTSIGEYAFEDCKKLASITLPENLTAISKYMFYNCRNLTNVTIPTNVTTIGKYAFAFCENLASITLSNGVTTIGEYAFCYCENLESITLPEKLTVISEGMLDHCKKLTDVTIPNGVTTIGEYAFEDCEKLASITLPEKLTNISKAMFYNCKNLTDVTIPNGVTTIGESAFSDCFSLSNITIPNSVKSIEYCAFDDCAIKDITIPSSVTFIGGRIFAYCSTVESVTFEGTPTLIDFTAFGDMKTVPLLILPDNWSREPYVDKDTKWYSGYFNLDRVFYIGKEHPEDVVATLTGDGTLILTGSGEMKDFGKNDDPPYYSISDRIKRVVFDETANITNIGDFAFYSVAIESITIPNSVTTIGKRAFYFCQNLKNITIPSSVTTIENSILDGAICDSVTFEGTPTTISNEAFVSMLNKPVLTLPDGWTGEPYVDENTLWYGGYFYGERPAVFYIGKEKPEDVWAVFNEADSTFTIYGEGEMMDFNEDYPPYYYFIQDKVKQLVFDETAHVTNIGNYAFCDGYENLESVTLPNSVKTIGEGAFAGCEGLESITLPNSVKTIGEMAFAVCSSLESITIPNGVTTIGEMAFAFCSSLESITIPSSVTSIGAQILYECYDLQSLTFEGSPESIHEDAFDGFNDFDSPIDLYLPEVWGGNPYLTPHNPWYGGFFNMKQAPTQFYIGKEHPEDVVATLSADGTLTISGSGEMMDYNVEGPDITYSPLLTIYDKIKQVVFDEAATVKNIGEGVFAECYNLTSVTLPETLTELSDYAFATCESLESITIPSSVISIGKQILFECNALQSVTFKGTPESIHEEAFSEFNDSDNPIDLNLPEVWGGELYINNETKWYGGYFNLKQTPTKFFIGKEHPEDIVATLAADGTLTITGSGEMMDANVEVGLASLPFYTILDKITQVVFDENSNVTNLGYGIFALCENLESITIPNSVISIGGEAFAGCERLDSITIPNSVTTIGNSAFAGCESLVSITIPNGVTTIGESTFDGCFSLESVTIPSSVTTIGERAFVHCQSLESVTIPNGVTTIGRHAFADCYSLESITIPSSVTTIGIYIVANTNITKVTFEGTPESIHENAFADMYTTPRLVLPSDWSGEPYVDKDTEWYGGYFDNEPEKVFYIGKENPKDAWAFLSDDGTLTIFGHGETADYYGYESPFAQNFAITNIVFDEDAEISTLGNYLFDNCQNLKSITIPNTVTAIGDDAFTDCYKLKDVTIPSSVTSIGEGAFGSCFALTNITLPETLTEISDYSFYYCESLESITIPSGVTTIGGSAFEGCYGLTNLTVPSSVTTIGERIVATPYGSNLQSLTFEGTPKNIDSNAFVLENNQTEPVLLFLPNNWSGREYINNETKWYEGLFNLMRIVAYNTNGGSEIANDTIFHNSKLLAPTDPTKTMSQFEGWYKDEALASAWNFNNDAVTKNITLYAKWHLHNPVADELLATCETDGYKKHYVCECGKAFTTADCTTEITDLAAWKVGDGLVPALNHDYALGEWTWSDDKSEASATFVCKNDETHVETVNATITTDTVDATCTEKGLITYNAVATFQGEEYKDVVTTELPAINHDYALNKWTWSDDKSEASATFVCKNDETHVETANATITTDTVKATVDQNGKITYTATAEFEGETYTDTKEDIIPAIGHEFVFGEWLWADDKKSCVAVFNCINEESHSETVDANVTADTLKATCTADGLITSYAVATFNSKDYKDTVTTVLPALNHDYALGEWNWADDNKTASVSFACKNDETHVETVTATVTIDTVKATVDKNGKITYTATAEFQGETYTDTKEDIIPALGHEFVFGEWLWSDDKKACSAVFKCINEENHTETVDAKVTADTLKATCLADGLITSYAVATFNSKDYKDTVKTTLPALNHDYALGKWTWNEDNSEASVSFVCKNDETHVENVDAVITTDTVKATCTEKGLITYNAVATFNGEEYKDVATTEIPALNHDYALNKWTWSDDKKTASVSFICKNDETHVETATATVTTDTVKATVDQNGKITYTATAEFEGETYTDTREDIIPAIGHEFVFGEWLWADDKKSCVAVFNCINEESHSETVDAKVTADTLKATCTADGLITSYAVATFNGEDYKDTVTTVLPAINHDYALGEWSWKDDNSAASVSFICNNDETHVENVDATITTDTLQATCTEDGSISYFAVATFQSEEYKDTVTTVLPALNHDYALGEWTWKDDKSEASVSFICNNDETHVETVNATITTDTVEATCTEKGLITYNAVATFQGDEYKDTVTTVLPALNHDYVLGEWNWSDDNSAASVSFICKNDETHVENIDATITTDTLQATCTEDGLISYFAVATFQGDEYKDTVTTTIPALNHDFALDKWLWSDDKSAASVSFICKNDETHVETVNATITTDTVNATCTEDGLISYFAVATFQSEEYKDTVTVTIPAIDHDYALGEWTWKDDKSEASVSFICNNDETHVENVDATITTDTLQATCTEDGLISYFAVATFQSEEYKDTVTVTIPAIDHDYALGEWTWKDDKSAASLSFICNNDETHVETVNATITTDTVDATCTEKGLITYNAVATFQGEEYKDVVTTELPAINHNFALNKWLWSDDKKTAEVVFTCKNNSEHADTVNAVVTTDTTAATADKNGKIVYTATAEFDGETYTDTKEDIIPAIGHEFVFGEWLWADDKATCAAVFNCINEENHSDTIDAKVTADTLKATCLADGLITSYAVATFNGKDYKDTVTTVLPALNHDYALGKWNWEDDKSAASVSFICKNDNSHVETANATITTDTVNATCTEDGLISYFAVATFQSEEYKDTVTVTIPAIDHDYALGEWTWKDDKSEASVSFICNNDETHVENVDATITTDTLQATCTEYGSISYFAVATFQGEEYKDTVTTVLPALNHDYVLGEWNWSDDNSAASLSFICNNDETHVENVDAIITTDTVKVTCTTDGSISYFAVATFQGEDYKDTVVTTIPALNHDYALGKWTWSDDNSAASVSFVCRNDESHVENIDATITTDTVAATTDKNGKITYTATAEFDGKTYTDTKEDIIPAIGHEFVFGEWLWADDKASCAAVFNCINEENHADTVDAKVTADTLKATCLADGLITSYAVATFNGKDYKDTVTTVLPALNHDYALGEWTWSDDNSAASVSFICNNDETHVETVNATITTDTVNATCTEDGKISYFAVATFQGVDYKDTVTATILATGHSYAFGSWLWSDDKSQCSAVFVCANDKQHADTVSAVVTSDTTAATLTENGKIVFVADVTYEEKNYSDTVEVVLYPSLAYADIIGLIQGTYCLTTYSGDEANRPAKDLYFKFYGTDTLTQGHFNDLNYKNINADDLSNIAVHNNRVTFDYKPNTTFSFSLDTALNTCTKVTVKNSALNQTCILTKTDTEEVDIADIWNIIEGSYINELGKVQNFIMEPDSETGKDVPCFMWVDQFDGDEDFENIDGYFPLAGDEFVRIEKTGNYYDFMVSGDKYFTLTIENDVVTGFMTYGYDDEDVFKGNYKKLAYSDILEKVQGTYSLTAVNGEPRTGDVQVEFEDEEFIFIRNGKTEQKTPVKNISQIMYTSDSIAVLFKDNSMFSFNVDNDTIAKVTLVSGDNVLEFTPGRLVPEAVDELTDNITVFIRNSEIVVSGLSHDDVVTIYAVNGKLLYKQLQTVETAAYNTYGKGIYFVKVGNKTFTVLY